jgi:Domain of unknown function (DUF427)
VNDYPAAITAVNHVEPVPRRIRAFLAGEKVLDTTGALYVWEWPYYPQYYIPVADVRRDLLIPEGHPAKQARHPSAIAANLQAPLWRASCQGSPSPHRNGTDRAAGFMSAAAALYCWSRRFQRGSPHCSPCR